MLAALFAPSELFEPILAMPEGQLIEFLDPDVFLADGSADRLDDDNFSERSNDYLEARVRTSESPDFAIESPQYVPNLSPCPIAEDNIFDDAIVPDGDYIGFQDVWLDAEYQHTMLTAASAVPSSYLESQNPMPIVLPQSGDEIWGMETIPTDETIAELIASYVSMILDVI